MVMDELCRVLQDKKQGESVGTTARSTVHLLSPRATGPYLRASVEEPMPSGERMLLLRAEWIWLKLGLSVLSFCQQSSISWWRCGGQLTGAGSLKPSSMALITYGMYGVRKNPPQNRTEPAWINKRRKALVFPGN